MIASEERGGGKTLVKWSIAVFVAAWKKATSKAKKFWSDELPSGRRWKGGAKEAFTPWRVKDTISDQLLWDIMSQSEQTAMVVSCQ